MHEDLLQRRPEWVIGFLAQTLRAAAWATDHPADVRAILARETGAGDEGVAAAYGPDFHATLAPDLSRERLDLLAIQVDFLARQGFVDTPFNVDGWAEHGILARALALA
ncbi:hypothetical protein [Pigmentiphaga litoralis]|uniref:hypothetical protein n=1 Tax=Pigmentiphaga litoralis TaxID=516702 RepID=UPI003B42F948